MAIQMKSRVLVVEDDEQLRRIITSNLVARPCGPPGRRRFYGTRGAD
jgi:hypothetical protein